jgi:uncharacterized membrane protein YccC
VATVVPLLLEQLFHTGGGTWMSLAGFTGSLADKGGPYRTRAATVAALTIGGAVTAAIGVLVGAHPAVAVPVTFIVATACTLGRAYGNAGASVAVSTLNIFVISLAYPSAAPDDWLTRAGFVTAGGLWAMLVSLVLWPIRPYRPVRLGVAAAYRAVADYADQVARAARDDSAPLPLGVRAALEAAGATLAAVRRGRPAESGRGERLLVLTEAADQMFGQLFGLSDVLESVPAHPTSETSTTRTGIGAAPSPEPARGAPASPGAEPVAAIRETLATTTEAVAHTARQLADAIESERGHADVRMVWSGGAVRQALRAAPSLEPELAANLEHGAALIDRVRQYAGVAGEVVAGLNDGTGPTDGASLTRPASPADREGPVSWLAPLRASLAPDSQVLRAALRVGVVTAAAVGLVGVLGLKRGYWVTITAVIILQPYAGATSRLALQRVLGTVVGGALTAALAALVHTPGAILGLTFVGAGLSVALLPLNYAAFSVFLTPTFVLLAEASAGDWHLAGLRITNTVLGGLLALAGSRLLWPTPETARAPTHLAAMLDGVRHYFLDVIERFVDRSEAASTALRASRRRAGLGILNADESVQRLVDEHSGHPAELTPVMTLVTYGRRFTASITALALSRHAVEPPSSDALDRFAGQVAAVLADLSAALRDGRPPAPYAEPTELPPEVSPLLRSRARRLARQLATLDGAVRRCTWRRAASPSVTD